MWWDGYRILERNFRARAGEVDIIARKRDTVVFVEVRCRREGSTIAPKDTIGHAKERRIASAASTYLKRHGLADVTVRFDIAQVWLNDKGRPSQIDIIEGAFGDPDRT